MPEIIDPVFAKTSPKRSFCMTENERIGLVFVKTGSMNSGTGLFCKTGHAWSLCGTGKGHSLFWDRSGFFVV